MFVLNRQTKRLYQYINLLLGGKYSVNEMKLLRYGIHVLEKWCELVVCCSPYNALVPMMYVYVTNDQDSFVQKMCLAYHEPDDVPESLTLQNYVNRLRFQVLLIH